MLECHLCGKRVRHDGEEVRAHAADIHGISTEGFFSGLRTELRRRETKECEVRVERMSEDNVRARIRGREEEEEDQGQAGVVVTHKIANLATFSCWQCNFSSSHWEELRSHMSGGSRQCSSQLSGRRKLLPSDFVSPGSAWHGCLLCGERVVCTVKSIRQHVCNCHRDVGMGKYRDRVRRARGQEHVKGDDYQGQAGVVVTNKIANLATFSCWQCNFSSAVWRELKSHLSGSRRCSSQVAGRGKLLRRNFVSPGSTWHGCLLCGERVICTVGSIWNHLFRWHRGIGMQEYRDKVRRARGREDEKVNGHQSQAGVVVTDEIANLATFSCRWCDFSSAVWRELRSHLSGSRQCFSQVAGRKMLLRDFVSPGSAWHGCVLCGERVVCTVSSIGVHVCKFHNDVGMEEYRDRVRRTRSKRVPPAFRNLCLYRCLHCGSETDRWPELVRHARDAHPRDHGPLYQTEEQWTAREVLHR